MLILISCILGGAVVFIVGYFDSNLITDTMDYIDLKYERAVEFGHYLNTTLNYSNYCCLFYLF